MTVSVTFFIRAGIINAKSIEMDNTQIAIVSSNGNDLDDYFSCGPDVEDLVVVSVKSGKDVNGNIIELFTNIVY